MAKEIDWDKVARDAGIGRDGMPFVKTVGPDLLRLIERLEHESTGTSADIQGFLARLTSTLVYRDPEATYRRSKRAHKRGM